MTPSGSSHTPHREGSPLPYSPSTVLRRLQNMEENQESMKRTLTLLQEENDCLKRNNKRFQKALEQICSIVSSFSNVSSTTITEDSSSAPTTEQKQKKKKFILRVCNILKGDNNHAAVHKHFSYRGQRYCMKLKKLGLSNIFTCSKCLVILSSASGFEKHVAN